MLSTRSSNILVALVAGAALGAPALAGQSTLFGTVSGSVTSGADGTPLARALVTLTALGATAGSEATTDAAGRFTFHLVAPGTYEVRVEALGFRPLVARTLAVGGGASPSLALELAQQPPPVLTVDTLTLAASAMRGPAGGARFGALELEALPYRLDDLASIAALAPSMDELLGSQGLPGSMTFVVADGVPFYRAWHPLLKGDRLPDVLFPRSSLSGVTVLAGTPDVEWAGSAGGYVAVDTRSTTRDMGPELEGSWSGDALWSSPELDIESPSLMSFQGAARTTIGITPGTSNVVVSAEALQHETPLPHRLSADLAGTLSGLDSELLSALVEPSTERLSRYSGLARFDARRGPTTRVFLRGAGAYAKRQFSGPGPVALRYGVGLADETIEYSFAGGIVSQYRPRLGLELRAGVSGSSRSFEAAQSDVAGGLLARTASPLGPLAGAPGESSRIDVHFLPLLRYGLGAGTLEVGARARASSFTMSSSPFRAGELLFSDGASLAAGQGFGRRTVTPEASFTTREVGAFLQYDFEPSPGLRVSIGGHFDWELVPDAVLNGAWLQASGLRNDEHPSSFPQLGGRAALSWDPGYDGRTAFTAAVGVHGGDLDPAVLYELYAQDTGSTSTRVAGGGLEWPSGTFPGGATALPTLTLVGPDARPPRSAKASVGLARELGRGLSIHIGGALRRTDFLLRRRDLNRATAPVVSDAYGRDVFGTLSQDGSLVTATDPDARRFPTFAEVWALDPDGWSEYRAITVGVEGTHRFLDLRASYTRSQTEDNWVGATRGSPSAALSPLLPEGDDWTAGRSDFDAPHRAVATAVISLGAASISAVYRFRSGLPFTPGYRSGVDANADGSIDNDVAVVPDTDQLAALASEWPCLASQAGGFARRNSCRAPEEHSLDAGLALQLGELGGRRVSVRVDVFNLIEGKGGIIDDALLLVDPSGSITTAPDGGPVTIPVMVNPDFGSVLYPSTPGRMLRVGLRIGS